MAEIPKKIIFDVENNLLRDSAGTEITDLTLFPDVRFGQKFTVNLQLTSDVAGTAYDKLQSGSGANIYVDDDYSNPAPIIGLAGDTSDDYWTLETGAEYYYTGTELTEKPDFVYLNSALATEGTKGSLAAGEWVWDSVNSRLVVRLADDADPDTKSDGWVGFKITVTYTAPYLDIDSSTFNAAGSWYDTDTSTYRDPVITDGELTFDINANTYDFYNRLSTTKAATNTTMQIQILDPVSADLYKLFEFNFVCRNVYRGTSYTVDVIGANVYNKAETDIRYVRTDLSGAYTEKTVLAGTENVYSRDGSTNKYCSVQKIRDLIQTSTNGSIANSANEDITLFDKTIYQRARLILTVEDSTRTNINDYEYPIGWDGTNAVDDGGDFRPWKGSAISGLAISFSVSGNNIICTLNNTSGGTLYYTYKIVDELILSQ